MVKMNEITLNERSVCLDGEAPAPSRARNLARSSWPAWMWLLLCLAALVLSAAMFLPHQSIWVDETTQLSGLTLSPPEAARWLAGEDGQRFGVPPDRTPPLSYWMGWAWSQMFGLSELSMRWFGIACVALAAVCVFAAARMAWGLRAAIVAGLLLALSPNTVVNAVEIRAYPVLLLWSAAAFLCLVGWITRPAQRPAWLSLLSVCCVAAMFTHFFGVLLTGSLFVALLTCGYFSGAKLGPVLSAQSMVMVSATGLWPFITAAFGVSGGNSAAEPPTVGELVKFIYRGLFGHPAVATSLAALAIATLCFGTLGLFSLLPKRRGSMASIGLAVALASGMGVAVLASTQFSAFDGLHPSYNLWRLPAFALLLASACAARHAMIRRAALTASIGLIAASAWGVAQLALHGKCFAHGAHDDIAQLIRELPSPDVAVIHDGNEAWGQAYYPLVYAFDGGVRQFEVVEAEHPQPQAQALPDGHVIDMTALEAKVVVVIATRELGWSDMTQAWRQGLTPFAEGAAIRALQASDQWREVHHRLLPAMFAAEVRVFERVDES